MRAARRLEACMGTSEMCLDCKSSLNGDLGQCSVPSEVFTGKI
jgi:hypothetical protein